MNIYNIELEVDFEDADITKGMKITVEVDGRKFDGHLTNMEPTLPMAFLFSDGDA